MYSAQRLEVPTKTTMERMYSVDSTLNGKDNMSSPRKENMLQSISNALNVVWEHFSRVPGSFMANINSPLSVTVVQNEGIISHEFFKSLTTRKEPLVTDNIYIHNTQTKESLNIVESIHCSMFDEQTSYATSTFHESMNETLKSSYKYLDAKRNGIVEKSDGKETIAKESNNSVEHNKSKASNTADCNSLLSINNMENEGKGNVSTNEVHVMKHFDCCTDAENKSTSNNEQVSDCTERSKNKSCIDIEPALSSSQSNLAAEVKSFNQATISNLFTNMWQKVVCGVTDRIYLRTEPVELEETTKRPFSPKQRRKLNTVAKGRGRGRARSQLRRSGVSQTRHRKERTKHDLVVDIQDDLENWREFEMYHTVEDKESVDCFSFDGSVEVSDAAEFILEKPVHPVTYTFADVKPRNRKSKTRKGIDEDVSKFPTRVRYVPDCTLETNVYHQDYGQKKYDSQRNGYRPRLVSESSVDSEDSYCIVFETGSEANYRSDLDNTAEESDEDQSTEDEESVSSTQKVKFNLKPTVHIMVQWDYAYRAARRGPWEEMARDRERFKYRINCIERVLNPILTAQHRTHIWQERFALAE